LIRSIPTARDASFLLAARRVDAIVFDLRDR